MQALRIKKTDYLVLAIILVWGLAGFWFNVQQVGAVGNKYATIYVQNEQEAELSLSDEDQYTYSFDFEANGPQTAVVEVEAGRIRMLPMEDDACPRHICSHTGWIERSYEKIVCLPNRIMITFNEASRDGETEDIDEVTY